MFQGSCPASTREGSSSVSRYELVGTIQRISYTRRWNDASLVVFSIPASGSDAAIVSTARVGASKRRGLRPQALGLALPTRPERRSRTYAMLACRKHSDPDTDTRSDLITGISLFILNTISQ